MGDTSSDIRRAVTTVGEVSSQWVAAHSQIPGIGVIEGIGVFRSAPVEFDLFSFANCNESSYRTAARTLDTMIAKFGLSSPQVKRWVDAQDQVFDNCSDGDPEFDVNRDVWSEMSDEWNHERNKVPSLFLPSDSSYTAAKGMRFRRATLELETMTSKLGASSPEVEQWAEKQDGALAACSNPSGGSAMPPEIPSHSRTVRHSSRRSAIIRLLRRLSIAGTSRRQRRCSRR